MNKKEVAQRIDVSLATLYNWEKTKPELIKLIKLGLEKEAGIPYDPQREESEKDKEIKRLQGVVDTLRGVVDTYQEIINKQRG